MLGNTRSERLSIVSFVVQRPGGRYLHHNFVVALLSDLFGIQSRGGCSCAGPYGHRLLGIDIERSHEFEHEIAKGCEGIKPGWTRVSFNYFISETVFRYIVDAVDLVAEHGWKLLPEYRFDPASGLWRHGDGAVEPPLRLSAPVVRPRHRRAAFARTWATIGRPSRRSPATSAAASERLAAAPSWSETPAPSRCAVAGVRAPAVVRDPRGVAGQRVAADAAADRIAANRAYDQTSWSSPHPVRGAPSPPPTSKRRNVLMHSPPVPSAIRLAASPTTVSSRPSASVASTSIRCTPPVAASRVLRRSAVANRRSAPSRNR